jgi:hypothetical protein
MNRVAIVDSNLLTLLVVGLASPAYIPEHKRLSGYSVDDFKILTFLVGEFAELVLIPHVLAEV